MWLLLPAALAATGCADLKPIASGVCGNEVVDALEDCDGHATSASSMCAPPGDAHECRYVCGSTTRVADGAAATCPTGFGCGVDGVCREFTGRFAVSSTPSSVSSFAMSAALFDPDGKPIVFVVGDDLGDGRRFPWIVDPDGDNVEKGTSIPVPMAQPTVMDLDGDGFQDIAFIDYPGIGVFRGQPAAQKAPFFAFPSALFSSQSIGVRGIAVTLGPGPHGENAGDTLVVLEDDGQTLTLRRLDAPGQPLLDLTATRKHTSDVTGDLLQAKFDARPGSCAAIALPLGGLSYVPVFTPCSGGAWSAPGSSAADVTLEAAGNGPATVTGRVSAMDVNSDQHLDLVVDTSAGPYAAFGRGDGTFSSTADLAGDPGVALPLALPWASGQAAETDVPLAGGDLNGDGKTDFVFRTGVALTDSAGQLYWGFRSSGWVEGLIARGEAGTPVVVGTSDSAGINFLVYAPAVGQFVSTWVPTANAAAHIVSADFDGDGVEDVAYVEQSASGGDTWSVVFGREAYIPSAPVVMATFDAVLQLSPGHLSAPYIGADAVADLVVSAKLSSANTETLATSLGSPTRQMIAPFQLRKQDGTQVLPLALAAGHFLHDAPSLGALAADDPQGAGTLRFWFFTADDAAATDLVMGDALSSSFHPTSFGGNSGVNLRYGAHMATGDLDHDGFDEVILVAPYGPDDSHSAFVIGETDGHAVLTSDPVVFPIPTTLYSILRVADVDGDGADDILFKGYDDDTPTAVTVFWNDGAGKFDAARTSALDVDGHVKDFVCVGGTTPCTLYALSEEKAFVLPVGRDRTWSAREMPTLQGGWSIASGDFDGDGIADLAIGEPTDLHLYYGVARLP